MNIHSLAVTTDFSETSRRAFLPAAALARRLSAPLYLLHVAQTPPVHSPWQVEESYDEAGKRLEVVQARLADLAASAPELRGATVKPRALAGETAERVEKFLRHEGVDLVVIAPRGATNLGMLPLGSFTARVLQLVSSPTLITQGPEAGGERPSFPPARILVPLDFSRPARAAAQLARDWAEEFGAEARLIFVAEEAPRSHGYLAGACDSVDEYVRRVRSEGLKQLRRVIDEDWKGLRAEAVAKIGSPEAEILNEARGFHADLIVMGNRGLSLIERLSLGSVAERTVQGASCPVLVAKQTGSAGELIA